MRMQLLGYFGSLAYFPSHVYRQYEGLQAIPFIEDSRELFLNFRDLSQEMAKSKFKKLGSYGRHSWTTPSGKQILVLRSNELTNPPISIYTLWIPSSTKCPQSQARLSALDRWIMTKYGYHYQQMSTRIRFQCKTWLKGITQLQGEGSQVQREHDQVLEELHRSKEEFEAEKKKAHFEQTEESQGGKANGSLNDIQI